MFNKKIKTKKKTDKYFISKSVSIIANKYQPKPIKANELLSINEAHSPIPEIVPKRGPKALSI